MKTSAIITLNKQGWAPQEISCEHPGCKGGREGRPARWLPAADHDQETRQWESSQRCLFQCQINSAIVSPFFIPSGNKIENTFLSLQMWLVTQATLPSRVPHLNKIYDENSLQFLGKPLSNTTWFCMLVKFVSWNVIILFISQMVNNKYRSWSRFRWRAHRLICCNTATVSDIVHQAIFCDLLYVLKFKLWDPMNDWQAVKIKTQK